MERRRGTWRPPAIAAAALAVSLGGAAAAADRPVPGRDREGGAPAGARDPRAAARMRMVKDQIAGRGIRDPRVLKAMETVPRHLFVPETWRDRAYEDGPLPIGRGQTISQPYIVAFMTEAIRPLPTDRVLEIGTGSGYQAAVLATLVAEVFSIEIHEDLARTARQRLADLGYRNVTVKHGDGHLGWPEHAPFDAIVVTAAPETVPQRLLDQLQPGGRLIAPVGGDGGDVQDLVLVTRTGSGFERRTLLPVRFVPMTGGSRPPD